MEKTLEQIIDQMKIDAANEAKVDMAAVGVLNGIQGRIDAAVQAALAKGATPLQLADLTDLSTTLETNTIALAAAIAAQPAPDAAAPAPATGSPASATASASASASDATAEK